MTFCSQGKLISVRGDHIAVNALMHAVEADKILQWFQREINDAWEKRKSITPSFEAAPRPQPFAILKFLPKTNCGKCSQPTCMVFASLAMEGGKEAEDCPELIPEQKKGSRSILPSSNSVGDLLMHQPIIVNKSILYFILMFLFEIGGTIALAGDLMIIYYP